MLSVWWDSFFGLPGLCVFVLYLCILSVSGLCALCGWVFIVQSEFSAWEGDVCCVCFMDWCVFFWGMPRVVELVQKCS